ncbi:MAG: hypothetical protein WD638_05675 [Nitriliruptoraceae bacterium]
MPMDGEDAAGSSAVPASSAASALPVALALSGAHRDAVGSWLEGTLGWQVIGGVDGEGVDDPVPPVLRLRDHASADRPGEASSRQAARVLPEILLVPDDAAPVAAATLAQSAPSTPVLGWPSQRDELPRLAATVLAAPVERTGTASLLVVGGSAGGVGTTTVAMALAGLKAWSGTTTLVAVRGQGLPWRPVPAAALADGDLWSGADRLPGLDAARTVLLTDQAPLPELTDPRIEAFVVDVGASPDCDVLVCRADAAGLWALERTTAAAVVVVGDGPLPARALGDALAGRRAIRLPHSLRVARAGVAHRVPAGLPGRWIAGLRPLLTGSSAMVRAPGSRHGDGEVWADHRRAAPEASRQTRPTTSSDRTRGRDRQEAWTTR